MNAPGSGVGRLVGMVIKSEGKVGVGGTIVGFSGANNNWIVGSPLWGVSKEGRLWR